MKRTVVAVTIVVLAIAAASVANLRGDGDGAPVATDPADVVGPPVITARVAALSSFDDCTGLLDELRSAAIARVGPWGLPGVGVGFGGGLDDVAMMEGAADAAVPSAAPAGREGVDFSGTNVQEAGVDEPDIVKTDGSRLWAVGTDLSGLPVLRELDVAAGAPVLVAEHPLADGWNHLLLLDGDRLLVVSQGGTPFDVRPMAGASELDAIAPDFMPFNDTTTLSLYDVGAPGRLDLVATRVVEGGHVSSRLVDGVARVVVHSGPPMIAFPGPVSLARPGPDVIDPAAEQRSLAESTARNRAILAATTIEDWLPRTRLEVPEGGFTVLEERPLVDCTQVGVPQTFAGFGFVSVVTSDLHGDLTEVAANAVQTDAQLVYASTENLYVATPRWWTAELFPNGQPPADFAVSTAIHQFDISDPTQATYVASGLVEGTLLNQFAMSEHEGVLRVATTRGDEWWRPQQTDSAVVTLRRDGGDLVEVGRVTGLGQGERIFSVRFLGDVGYVVTFRQTDPLYTVDLHDPAAPRVTGELKILGYSAYLHPVGDGLLLGVGQDATEQGRTLGTQVSLFDVSDPSAPRRLQATRLADAYSEAEYDHHAFLYWPPTGRTVVPLQTWTGDQPLMGALTFEVDPATGIDSPTLIRHEPARPDDLWRAQIRRASVIGDRLLTISDAGVLAQDLTSLAGVGWVPFG